MSAVSESLRVNLHCHSRLSDGTLEPEELAERLGRAGVRVAALTDHDTVAGLQRFQSALARHGIGCVSGLELTCTSAGQEVHLLAYGFDAASPHLAEALRRARDAASGGLPVREAARLVHAAGGRVFLAHPLQLEADLAKLEARAQALQREGLDGLEAIYAPYSDEQIHELLALTDRLGLAVSAGCDFHGPDVAGLGALAVNMPVARWRTLRTLLFASSAQRPSPAKTPALPAATRRATGLGWRSFLWRIVLPTVVGLALLAGPLFGSLIPAFEEALLGRKREMIRELTRSASSILDEYEAEVVAGRLTLGEAQRAAVERVRGLRYGPEGKDYFWITDLHPKMIMHPYRGDLDGSDLTGFVDPRGNRLFVEFARVARARGEGYVEYVWQWKDDPARLAPKQSYVRLFEPWGWIIGTGIYLDDVHAELSALTGRAVRLTGLVAAALAALLLFLAQQSFSLERRRAEAETSLRESHERYRALVEASREGTLLVLDGRPVLGNQTFAELSGLGHGELALVELDELFELSPGALPGAEPRSLSRWLESAAQSERGATGASAGTTTTATTATTTAPLVRAQLRCRDDRRREVLLSVEPLDREDRRGAVVVVRDVAAHEELAAAQRAHQARLHDVVENVNVGVLRIGAQPPYPLVEANPAARALLGVAADLPVDRLPHLEGLLDPETAARELFSGLEAGRPVAGRVVRLGGQRAARCVAVSAVLVRGEDDVARFIDVALDDATARERAARARDAVAADLQAALLSLAEPVRGLVREAHGVPLGTSVAEAALRMTREDTSALVVRGPSGEPLGIVTDRDFRARVVAAGLPVSRSVHEIMSAPLRTVRPGAHGHAALELMREARVQHLAVTEESGELVGLVHGHDFLDKERYPVALLVRAIGEAAREEDAVALRERLPFIVKALVDSGARPQLVSRAITSVTDALTRKLLGLARARLGPAPARSAFLALGSQGREEQTLASDQDSAIVFVSEEPGEGAESAARSYFLELAERVSEQLAAAGVARCRGDVMASRAAWCRSLASWQARLDEWVAQPEPQRLLESAAFFDLRPIDGDASLAEELQGLVAQAIVRSPAFLGHLAHATLQYKPPIGLFGTLVGSERGQVDLKEAHALLVHVARLYALKLGLRGRSTLERLEELGRQGVLSARDAEELRQASEHLVGLRLRSQVEHLIHDEALDHRVELRRLAERDRDALKHALQRVALLQKKVSFDFFGGG